MLTLNKSIVLISVYTKVARRIQESRRSSIGISFPRAVRYLPRDNEAGGSLVEKSSGN